MKRIQTRITKDRFKRVNKRLMDHLDGYWFSPVPIWLDAYLVFRGCRWSTLAAARALWSFAGLRDGPVGIRPDLQALRNVGAPTQRTFYDAVGELEKLRLLHKRRRPRTSNVYDISPLVRAVMNWMFPRRRPGEVGRPREDNEIRAGRPPRTRSEAPADDSQLVEPDWATTYTYNADKSNIWDERAIDRPDRELLLAVLQHPEFRSVEAAWWGKSFTRDQAQSLLRTIAKCTAEKQRIMRIWDAAPNRKRLGVLRANALASVVKSIDYQASR